MKIVTKLANSFSEVMMSFPFLQTLHNEFPIDRLHVILHENYSDLLKLLPFDVSIHPIDNSVTKHPFSIHKYCYNEYNIFNVDLFFNLENSAKSNLFGKLFKSKYNIGYKAFGSRVILNKSYAREHQEHLVDEWMQFINDYTGNETIIPKMHPNNLHDKENIQGDYIVVQVFPSSRVSDFNLSDINKTLLAFENEQFVFVGLSSENEMIECLIEQLYEQNNGNTYLNLAGKTNLLQLASITQKAKGTICVDSGFTHFSSYLNTPVLTLYNENNFFQRLPHYFDTPYLIGHLQKVEGLGNNEVSIRDIKRSHEKLIKFFS